MTGYDHRIADSMARYRQGDTMRFNDDYVVMPLQAATQWDALSHIYYGGSMFNGFPSTSVTVSVPAA